MAKPTKQVYSFQFKLALVVQFLAGETAPDLAAEAGLSSSGLLKNLIRCLPPRGRFCLASEA